MVCCGLVQRHLEHPRGSLRHGKVERDVALLKVGVVEGELSYVTDGPIPVNTFKTPLVGVHSLLFLLGVRGGGAAAGRGCTRASASGPGHGAGQALGGLHEGGPGGAVRGGDGARGGGWVRSLSKPSTTPSR